MRIVGGTARGRTILVPPVGTRPTSARAREALFNRLDTLLELDGARVLDLYAGSGAVGVEALSRGAAHVRFVESDRRAAALIARNVETVLGEPGGERGRVDVRTVSAVLAAGAPEVPYDLVFADPPYALAGADLDTILGAVSGPRWLVAGGLVVVERSARTEGPRWPERVEDLTAKRYGEGVLWYGRTSATDDLFRQGVTTT